MINKNLANLQKNYKIWEFISGISGWAGLLWRKKCLDDNTIQNLEQIDEDVLQLSKEVEKDYYQNELPKIKQQIQEFKQELGEEGKQVELNYLVYAIEELQTEIQKIYKDYLESFKWDKPFWLRKLSLELQELGNKEKKLKRFLFEYRIKKYGKQIKNRITDEMILRAREYPFENLIKAKHYLALCPFHEEKTPSFYIKNNFGFCFGCGWKGDIIKFVMERDGLDFIKAIESLQ